MKPDAIMRNLLIVSTTFFPHPHVGSVRVTNWGRMLPDLGWRPTALCRWYGYRATRSLLDAKVSPHVDLRYLDGPFAGRPLIDIPDAAGDEAVVEQDAENRPGARPETWVSRQKRRVASSPLMGVFVPDQTAGAWRRSVGAARREARRLGAEAILTSGPSHAVHLVGRSLARSEGLPWIVDFRDPYLMDPRFRPSGLGRLFWSRHAAFERSLYEEASALLHAIPLHARWASRRYPRHRSKIIALPHPVPSSLSDTPGAPPTDPLPPPEGRRSVRVIGFIRGDEARDLASAVRALVDQGEDLELRLVGRLPESAREVRRILGDRAVITGRVRHDLAKRQIATADLLVSFLTPERARANYGVSSKLFEFAAAGKPVIEINPTVPDRQLLRRLPGVVSLSEPSVGDLTGALRRMLAPESVEAAASSPEWAAFREAFSWTRHAEGLGAALELATRTR